MEIYDYLKNQNVTFERHDHPPVYTCEEANRLIPNLPGAKTKNLFVRDKKGARHFLVLVSDEKQVDLEGLAERLGSSRLSMGSPERLRKYLGIEPGAVSVLAILNDRECAVEVVLDESLWKAEAFQCHPLVNTSTLVVSREGIEQLLESSGHRPLIIDVPARELRYNN